jgi:hypothetical protein
MQRIDTFNCLLGSLGLVTACAALVVSVRSCRITQEQTEIVRNELNLSQKSYNSQRTINLKFSVSGDRGQTLSWEAVDPQFIITDAMFYSYSGNLENGNGSLGHYGRREGSVDLSSTLDDILRAYEAVDYKTLFVMQELSERERIQHYIRAPSGYFPICADITYNYQGAKIERSAIVEILYSDGTQEEVDGEKNAPMRFRTARIGRIVDRSIGCERPSREAWIQWVRDAFLSFGYVEVEAFTSPGEDSVMETPAQSPR